MQDKIKLLWLFERLGELKKTIFILDYITKETLRKRIHRGLDKGVAMNGLDRTLFFGMRGEFREGGIQDQLLLHSDRGYQWI